MANGKNRAKVKKGIKQVQQQIKTAEKEIHNEIKLNVPNTLTLLRLVFVFLFVYMLFANYNRVTLVIVFAIAALTDWFDGYFARKLGQTSKAGARMDQVIDRVFTAIVVFSLIFFVLINNQATINHMFSLSSTNVFLLLFLSVSREIIGLPGFMIALIRNKDPYQVKYIGKFMTFIQGFALGAIILSVSWAVYIVVPTCIIGIIAGFDYLRYSLS